jgi:hypothetical protein
VRLLDGVSLTRWRKMMLAGMEGDVWDYGAKETPSEDV